MIRFAKRLIGFAACIVVALVLVRFGPTLWVRIFGGGNTQWISERFSETLREKNELVVYEVEITGRKRYRRMPGCWAQCKRWKCPIHSK